MGTTVSCVRHSPRLAGGTQGGPRRRGVNTALAIFALATLLVADPSSVSADHVSLEIEAPPQGAPRGGRMPFDVLASIESGWHINGHKPAQSFLIATALSFTLPAGVSTGSVEYPPPVKKKFAFSGDDELLVYEGKLGLATTLNVPADYTATEVEVEAVLRYQACNDTTCRPPATARTSMTIAVVAADKGAGIVDDVDDVATGDGSARFERWLQERGFLFTIAAVALLGVGLNLTPCVYPLISVTIAFFGGQARTRSTQLGLAITYVLGIALSFSILGVAAALSGGLFGAALQQPPVLIAIAAVLVTLALSSFGLYELRVPTGVMQWAGGSAHGVAGALFMGLTMGVVAAPCVGPVVLGLLVFVGSRQDPALGFTLFFVLALGMGAPYLALAMAAGSLRRLPRSGEWLVWTERVFGCVLLAMAAYFLGLALPEPARSLLMPAVIAASGIYLGFVSRAGRALRPALTRGLGIAFIAIAIWLGLPAGPQATIAWAPLDPQPPTAGAVLERPLLVDFAAEWCIPCREMDRTTYVDPDVLREAERFRMVKGDITEENPETTALVERYQVRGVPTVILFSRTGHERHRLVGYVGPQEMLEAMRQVE